MSMSREQRVEYRRKTMVGHVSRSHAEADAWDLEFWQKQTPQDRLSALVAIRNDIAKVDPEKLKDKLNPGWFVRKVLTSVSAMQ